MKSLFLYFQGYLYRLKIHRTDKKNTILKREFMISPWSITLKEKLKAVLCIYTILFNQFASWYVHTNKTS